MRALRHHRSLYDEIRRVLRGHGTTRQEFRDRLLGLLSLTVTVQVGAMIAIYFFERNEKRGEIHTLGDSAFWTATQILTVSSQLPNPQSTGGRITDVFLQAFAVCLVGAIGGAFASFFHRRSTEKHGSATQAPRAEQQI